MNSACRDKVRSMATQPVPPGLSITRYQGDLSNPDVATAQTVEVMCEQIQKAAQDPLVAKAARDAVNRFRGGPLYASAGINPWRNQCAQAESVWWWCKHVLKFQHHDGMIAVYFNEFDQLQLLISPDLLLRMSDPRGDCAIYTMLECAMLQALGIDSEIVTSAVDPFAPDVFSHVYPRAVLSSGRRIVLDASHGKYPGWEVPIEHTLRKQVWDLQGNRIPDQVPRFKGLHAVPPTLVAPPAPNPCTFSLPQPVGCVDFSNPVEIGIWGAIAAAVAFAPEKWKFIIPAALLFVRYELSKVSL